MVSTFTSSRFSLYPTPFRFDVLHLDTIFSSWGIYHCLIRFFSWFPFFFFFHCTTLCFTYFHLSQFSSVQSFSHHRLFTTPWITAHQASLSIANLHRSFKLMFIESVIPPSLLILHCPLLFLTPIPPGIRVFFNESTLHVRVQSVGVSALASVLPMNIRTDLFRMDRLYLFADQGILKCLPHHHSSKASILQHSAFFTVHLSHSYMTTGKKPRLDRLCWPCNITDF